jgi:hypothetical protein
VHISIEACEEDFGSHRYDGLDPVDTLIARIQPIPENHHTCTLDYVLIGIPVQWWEVHREPYREWVVVEVSMQEIFRPMTSICRHPCPSENSGCPNKIMEHAADI